MRRVTIVSLVLVLLVFTAGCASMGDKSKKGSVVGGLLGAAAGGIIGHQSGHGVEGALIGGAAGAIGGGLIGNSMDKKALATNPDHITVIKIAEMSTQGIPEGVIISEIKRTRSVYELSSEVITYLKENKVSDRVIDYMLTGG